MKKYIWPIILCIIVGIILGKLMFNQYNKKTDKVSANIQSEKVIFFQAGVYSNIDNMKKASSIYENYVYMKKDDKYYVFLAMTKNMENKEKLKNYFESLGYSIYAKEIEVDNSGFLQTLDQYDLLLRNAKTNDEIKSINKSVLAEYEELMNIDQN